jgi:hypothetical protein
LHDQCTNDEDEPERLILIHEAPIKKRPTLASDFWIVRLTSAFTSGRSRLQRRPSGAMMEWTPPAGTASSCHCETAL